MEDAAFALQICNCRCKVSRQLQLIGRGWRRIFDFAILGRHTQLQAQLQLHAYGPGSQLQLQLQPVQHAAPLLQLGTMRHDRC